MAHAKVKVGSFEGDVRERLKKYSDVFYRACGGLKSIEKYGLDLEFDGDKYLVMVIQGKIELIADYSMIVSVMGPDKDKVEEIMKDIEEKTQLELREPPEGLQEAADDMAEKIEMLIKNLYIHTFN